MRKKRNVYQMLGLAALLPLFALSATACDDDNDTNTQTSQLRVVHLSADAPGVDVWANDSARVISDLGFGSSTTYLTVDAGTYDFDVSATGTSASDSVLSIMGAALNPDKSYTAVAYDNVGSIKALLIEDTLTGIPDGSIRVRAIHTAAGVGEVDIWNIPQSGAPAPLYENVGFGDAGAEMDLPAGAYTVGFDVDNDAVPDLVFNLPSLSSGTHVNIFAVADTMGVYLVAQLPDGSTTTINPEPAAPDMTELRVLHLSPDAPSVDIWAFDSLKAVEELAFEEGTGYLEIEAGTYDFNITAMGADPADAVLTIAGLDLAADTRYTAVAFDSVSQLQALALVDDYEDLAMGDIRVRAIHTAVGVGEVDIWEVSDPMNPQPLYVDFDFGQVGAYLDLPAGAYTLGFDVDNDEIPDLVFSLPSLAEGTVANVFAATDGMAAPFLLAQFADGSTARINPDM